MKLLVGLHKSEAKPCASGVLGVRCDGIYITKAATKQLTDSLSNKWYRAYLATFGYVRARLYLNLVRDFSLIVQGLSIGRIQPVIRIPEDGIESYILAMQEI